MQPNAVRPEPAALQRVQRAFAAHIRDAAAPAPDDVTARRMALYRELFYNNIEQALANAYPVLRSLYAEADWHALVSDFFARHRCRSPLFGELPHEFLHYLQDERSVQEGDAPYLLELAHYEWVELALALADDTLPEAEPAGDLLDGVPLPSPLAWNLSYHYPVHTIGPDNPAPPARTTQLLVYRDEGDTVRFLEINLITARLLLRLEVDPHTSGRQQLEALAREIDHPDPDQLIAAGREILEDLRRRGVLLGTRPHSDKENRHATDH
jgi:hypothetical protein